MIYTLEELERKAYAENNTDAIVAVLHAIDYRERLEEMEHKLYDVDYTFND